MLLDKQVILEQCGLVFILTFTVQQYILSLINWVGMNTLIWYHIGFQYPYQHRRMYSIHEE